MLYGGKVNIKNEIKVSAFWVNNLALSLSLAGQQSGRWKGLQKPDLETLIL